MERSARERDEGDGVRTMTDDRAWPVYYQDAVSLRAALALELDGAASASNGAIYDCYRMAASLLGSRLAAVRTQIDGLGDTAIAAVGSQFDPTHRMLSALVIRHVAIATIDDLSPDTRVAFLGCAPCFSPRAVSRVTELLAAGALLVTSDKSALLPPLAPVLRPGSPQAPRQINLDVNHSMWCVEENDPAHAPLSGFVPKVRLSPGSLAIDPAFERDADAWVLASDTATTAPIAILMAVGGGQVLHSVAHWWQEDTVPANHLDSRLVAAIPGLRCGEFEDSDVTFGRLCCAWGMLQVLTAGLTLALRRADLLGDRSEVVG